MLCFEFYKEEWTTNEDNIKKGSKSKEHGYLLKKFCPSG